LVDLQLEIPLGIWGDPSNLGNGYTYVGNNPWSYLDPWGDQECKPSKKSTLWEWISDIHYKKEQESLELFGQSSINRLTSHKDISNYASAQHYIGAIGNTAIEGGYETSPASLPRDITESFETAIDCDELTVFRVLAVIDLTTFAKFDLRKIKKFENLSEIWDIDPFLRGEGIENYLSKTDYKDWYRVSEEYNKKFPLVDFQKGNNLVSLKTADTRGSSWYSNILTHIVDLKERGATVNGNIANMILDLRVQPGGKKDALPLKNMGEKIGVTVIIREF
jgi:hypothetical protein